MNKKELKKTIESETVQFSDMSSKNSYIHIESAINALTQHNRSQVLVDLISEFWGTGIIKKIDLNMYQYFDIKKRFQESDFISDDLTIIGEKKCCGNFIDVLYSEEKKCFQLNDGIKISGSIEGLFRYMATDDSVLPVVILPNTIELLKNAGWFEGRKTDISTLMNKYKNEGITLTEPQIAFFQEFGGIKGKDKNGETFEVYIDPKCSQYLKCVPATEDDLFSYNALNIIGYREKIDFLLAGSIGNLMVNFWISTDGRLFTDQGVRMGRTIMEGWQSIWNCQEMCSQKIPKILDRQESGDTMSRLS